MTPENVERLERTFADLSRAFARALQQAAVGQGLDSGMSERITRQMIAGSLELLQATGRSAADLMGSVASKGGTTEAGLAVMNAQDGIDSIVSSAVAKAMKGGEM